MLLSIFVHSPFFKGGAPSPFEGSTAEPGGMLGVGDFA
jgi:hypothetical protein